VRGGIAAQEEQLARREATFVRYAGPEEVFRAEYDRLCKALTVLGGDREAAADAVQEAFVRLIGHWEIVGRYDNPCAWTRRVAVQRLLDHRRSVARRARLLLHLSPASTSSVPAASPDERLWRAVRELPRKQRTALVLHYVADLTAREVAETMRVSEGTVSQHLHRAREALRRALEETP
jgi:RNA polymerase sigma-70 factor (ECF subfamily)